MDPAKILGEYTQEKDTLVAIDSDGCVFDTMEIKHKECFIPNIIKYWDLQGISKYARQAAEFVNLYSKWRGINRFPALVMVFDLLRDWPAVKKRGVNIPIAKSLRKWIEKESKLSNSTLASMIKKQNDEDLIKALEWSEAVNKSISDMVRGIPPFAHVVESLVKISQEADIIVCSATPVEALKREWEEHGIDKYVKVIAGQEMGSKKEHIHYARAGRYNSCKTLMIGDAPGDLKAAKENGVKFLPINPGSEENSWRELLTIGFDKFINCHYDPDYESYESNLIDKFNQKLPDTPPWLSITE
jgi:phosphoglycolate phosphatase-like HAD superfamily hydrolase